MEVFNALGASVAEGSPFPWTAVSGYSNGSTGYLPTAEAFWARGLRGGDGQPLRPGGRGALRGGEPAAAPALTGCWRAPSVEGLARGACLPTCHLRYWSPPSAAPHCIWRSPSWTVTVAVPRIVAPLVPHHAQVSCGGQVVGGEDDGLDGRRGPCGWPGGPLLGVSAGARATSSRPVLLVAGGISSGSPCAGCRRPGPRPAPGPCSRGSPPGPSWRCWPSSSSGERGSPRRPS